MKTPKYISGLAPIIKPYKACIFDLWGVVHNGQQLFDGILQTFTALKKSDRKIAILSNAPRQTFVVREQLKAFGLMEQAYDVLYTSGQHCHEALNDSAWREILGETCFHIGPPRNESLLAGTPIHQTDDLRDASFVLVSGPLEGPALTVLLENALALGLPMVCANPDKTVIVGDERQSCSGAVTQAYEAMGGTVHWFGKPYEAVYQHCMKALGIDDPSQILMIGDSLETDIQGAVRSNLVSCLIIDGIHGEAIMRVNDDVDHDALARLCQQILPNHTGPDFIMKQVAWEGA
ncbi:MAG: TIGR01459 family HAD-type hydrolase [Pseudomonadota bacterium]